MPPITGYIAVTFLCKYEEKWLHFLSFIVNGICHQLYAIITGSEYFYNLLPKKKGSLPQSYIWCHAQETSSRHLCQRLHPSLLSASPFSHTNQPTAHLPSWKDPPAAGKHTTHRDITRIMWSWWHVGMISCSNSGCNMNSEAAALAVTLSYYWLS